MITGLVFAGLTYLISAAASGDFSLGTMTLYDALACALAGIISGIIAVNVRNHND